MELILLILKIILIAFLVVLGLIILAIGIVLFVPVHYEISGSIGDSWDIRVKGKLTYLLSAIKALLLYEEEQFDVKLFLFGFEKKMQEEDEENIPETVEEAAEEAEITLREKDNLSSSEQESEVTQEVTAVDESITQEDNTQKESKKPKQKKEKKNHKFDFAFWKRQLTDEHNKSVVRKLWAELCYLLKHFKFRKIVTDFVFATGDPATTGQALGVLCMIPTLYRYNFKMTPDFEADEAYIKGTFLVAGKVRLIHILVTILRLIFDKEVRLVVKRILSVIQK